MTRISPGRSGSEYWTRIRSPSSFILMRQSKIKMRPHTEWGTGCRCRVRSPLLCGTVPFYGTGARADARIRTLVSILKPRTAPFLKLNCKKHEWIHQKVGADPSFFQKYHVPDPWVWIHKKTHQNAKCNWFRIRRWSGSANHTKLNANACGSGFKNFYADPRLASDPYHTVRTPSSGYNRARTSLV